MKIKYEAGLWLINFKFQKGLNNFLSYILKLETNKTRMNLFRHGGLNSFPVDTDLYGGGISHPGIIYFSSVQLEF